MWVLKKPDPHRGAKKYLCHKRVTRFAPLCANTGFFATFQKCFGAGLVMGKRLISKWDSEKNAIQAFLTLNQWVEGSIPSALTKPAFSRVPKGGEASRPLVESSEANWRLPFRSKR